jgi:hypothetical protein
MQSKSILIAIPAQFGLSNTHYYWSKYLSRAFKVTYYSFGDKVNNSPVEFPVELISIPFHDNKLKRVFYYYFGIVKLLKQRRFDYIIVSQYKIDFIIKFLFPVRKMFYNIQTGGVKGSFLFRAIHDFQLFVSSVLYNHILILDDNLSRKLGISASKRSIIPLGADIISKEVKSFEKLKLLYIGTLYGRNLEVTIHGFAKFLKDYPESTYSIIGEGYSNEIQALRLLTKTLNIESNVFILGRKSHREAKRYFDECNIGVSYVPMTSFYDLQPPTKSYEYILSGLFCIATNTTANSKIINGINGILLRKDDAESFYRGLVEISSKTTFATSEEIRQTILDFKWENIITNRLIPALNRLD